MASYIWGYTDSDNSFLPGALLLCFFIPPEQRSCWGIYWFHSVRSSVRLSVRPSHLPCPLCNIYSSGWILSILATNDHYHERVCRTQWPLTLTYIFKVIRPWLIFIFSTNAHYHSRVCRVLRVFQNLKIWPFGLGLENLVRSLASTVLDGFFPYLTQMITSMRRCVACDDLWPWPISLRSFDLDFENRVRSVAFSVLDWLFPYLPQIITAI